MTKQSYATPTGDDLAALQAFADAHGRKWKETLSMVYWYNARLWTGVDGRDENIGSTLHGIRNNFGPTWLYDHCKITPAPKPSKRVTAQDVFTNPKGWMK